MVQDVLGGAIGRVEEQLETASQKNCFRRGRGLPRRPFGQCGFTRSTSNAHGINLSTFSRNSSRFVRRLFELCSESANDSDISIVGVLPNRSRSVVAQGVVAQLELNCKPPLPVSICHQFSVSSTA